MHVCYSHVRIIIVILTVLLCLPSTTLVSSIPAQAHTTHAVQNATYTEDFSSYTNKDSTDDVEWDIWQKTLRLTRPDGAHQEYPDIVVDDDGNTVIVWQDTRNGDRDIYAQKLDTNGNRLWNADVRVNTDNENAEQWYPDIDVDAFGNVIIVWTDRRDFHHVYAQKLDTNGNKQWNSDMRVNDDRGTAPRAASVNIDMRGNAVIAWEDGRDYNFGDIYMQVLEGNGNRRWNNDIRVNTDSGNVNQESPVLATDHSGHTTIVWVDEREGNRDIYAQRMDYNGTKLWGEDRRVNNDIGTTEQYDPAIVADGSGQTFVVWHDNRTGNRDIYAQVLDTAGGHAWYTDLRVNTDGGTADQFTPAIAMHTSENVVISWKDQRNIGYDVYAQKIDKNSNRKWSTDVRITPDNYVLDWQCNPSIAVDNDGSTISVWADSYSGNYDIRAQKVDTNAQRQWQYSVQVNADSGTAQQHSPAIAVEDSGHAVVVWKDYRNGKYDIYAQKFDTSGSYLWDTYIRVNASKGEIGKWIIPDVAVDENGNAFIVWEDDRNGHSDIYAQILDTHGNRQWSADLRVNSDTDDVDLTSPTVAVDGNGHGIVVWSQHNSADMHAQKLNMSGEKLWDNERLVSTESGTRQKRPVVAVDHNQDTLVVWLDYRNDNYNVFAQKLNSAGNRQWTTDRRVNIHGSDINSYHRPAMAMDSNGQAIIVWIDERGINEDIYAQRVDINGNPQWSLDVRVNNESRLANQWAPDIAVDINGNAIIVWSEEHGLFSQKLDTNGQHQWPADMHTNTTGEPLAQQASSGVTIDEQGNALIVWEDQRNGNPDIYAQRLNLVGNRVWPADLPVVYPDRFYMPVGTAQSRTIDTLADEITSANLTATTQPNGGEVQFFLSNNGGTDWAAITPGVTHVFTTTGSDLRWQVRLARDPLWPRTPLVSDLQITYGTTPPGADQYEPDDTCAQAQPIAVNGAPQPHSFHQPGDADWVRFAVTAGTAYIIQTSETDGRADTTLDLRSACPQAPLAHDASAFGREARIAWTATASGLLYARVRHHDPAIGGDQTGYALAVRTATRPPVALIVAGHDDTFSLQANIDYAADLAYRTFLNTGVPKANIRYLGPNVNRDVDSNGRNDDIAGPAAPDSVRQAIEDWAREQGVGLGVPFYLYLVDHGHYDQFLAAGTAGRIQAADLDLWLRNLEATSGTDEVNVIIEACKSGSFIDVTAAGPARIAGRNRVVIASTSSSLDAYASTQGAHFSDAFWTALGQSQDLQTAFARGKQTVQATGLPQQPWLDDTGDGVADGQDGRLARGRGLGLVQRSRPPIVDWVQVGQVQGGQGAITAQVRDDGTVGQVRMEVYAPDFAPPPPTTDATTPEVQVPTTGLTRTGGDEFAGRYTAFTQSGTYRVVVYAEDGEGNQALPYVVHVEVGDRTDMAVYLPLITR